MKLYLFISLLIVSYAASSFASDVSTGDVEIVLKRANPKATLAERKFLARRSIAQASPQTKDEDLAESSLQFSGVPRAYIGGATLPACEARYRDFMKRLVASKVAVLQLSRCQRVIAPVQSPDRPGLAYQGTVDFIK